MDVAGLKRSVVKVRDLIQDEIDNGTQPERIVLAGFSQGGVLALQTALYYHKPLAGILALSTFLGEDSRLGSAEAEVNANIPILMCHGQQDAVLPFELGKSSRDSLQAAGYSVEWREYPMGHEVCLEEIRAISAWLQSVLKV